MSRGVQNMSGIAEAFWDEFGVLINKIKAEAPDLLPRCNEHLSLYIEEQYRWESLEMRIEEVFVRHPEWTPRKMAEHIRYYQRMPNSMRPLIVKRAQKVKNRLRMRKQRQDGESERDGDV
ncbi:MAG: hypothetical protein NPIRA02_02080 [Nitrospirales bacterium]|nr:MAG: hypothetical protein NPIRA02_02080 [Nitrospirales bacterium]